jgi:peptide/nickel transport system substrate-binding protein
VRAALKTELRFIPVIDLAFVDPIFSSAQVARNHRIMVFDTLDGMTTKLGVSPQMVEGHTVYSVGLLWNLRLREAFPQHPGQLLG